MYKKNSVSTRLNAIKELIQTHAIEDQEALVALMKKKYGIDTNQTVVSRDLRQLGASKQQVDTKLIYELKNDDSSKEILRLAVIDITHNETLIIIKTLPGMAGFVAEVLDIHENVAILGTLAGENAIFVAPTSIKQIKEIYKQVCKILYYKG